MTKQITISLALMERLVEALDKLARLGNEPHFGNSDGNVIAQEALTAGRAALDGAGRAQERERIANEPTGHLGVRTGPIANQASACG